MAKSKAKVVKAFPQWIVLSPDGQLLQCFDWRNDAAEFVRDENAKPGKKIVKGVVITLADYRRLLSAAKGK